MTIKRNRFLLTTSLALIGFTMTTALADQWNKETILQFSAPVKVPGKVLEPGKYVFQLADSSVNRNIVQIFSEDDKGGRHLVTTFFAVPDYRLTTPDKTMIQFEERRAGTPEAIKRWFYPGDNTGWEFTYPKSARLEAAANAPVPVPDPAPETAPPPAPSLELPPGVPAPQLSSLIIEEEETFIAQLEPASTPVENNQTGADRMLPETAGQSAMLLIAGVTILGAGLAAVSVSLCRNQA